MNTRILLTQHMPIDIPGSAKMMVTCHLGFGPSAKARGETTRLIVMNLTDQKPGARDIKVLLRICDLFVEK